MPSACEVKEGLSKGPGSNRIIRFGPKEDMSSNGAQSLSIVIEAITLDVLRYINRVLMNL